VDTAEFDAMTDEQLRERVRNAGMRGGEGLRREELIAVLARTDDAMTRSEERLVPGTQVYEIGRARLRKYVITEEVQVTVPVRREEIRLEREPITAGSQDIVEDPDVFGAMEVFGTNEGGVIFEVTLHQERALVTTEIVPVERVRLTKVVETEQEMVSGPVRKERIEIELPGQAPTPVD
jgi:stress response protein YsnF